MCLLKHLLPEVQIRMGIEKLVEQMRAHFKHNEYAVLQHVITCK